MEILLGLFVLAVVAWFWGKGSNKAIDSSVTESRETPREESAQVDIAVDKSLEAKSEPLSNLDKMVKAREILHRFQVSEHLFSILNTGWHVVLAGATHDIEVDEFSSDRIVALGYDECYVRATDYVASLPGFEWREPNCFVLDDDQYDFFILQSDDEKGKSRYRLHILVNQDLVADFGVDRGGHRGSELDWIPLVTEIEKLFLGEWVENLETLVELLTERKAWREAEAVKQYRKKDYAERNKQLEGKIDLGDYEP